MQASATCSRVAVTSSSVKSVGYDAALSTLDIEFSSGAVYRYFAVPAAVHFALMSADSVGAFVGRRIRNGYPFCRL
jgi:hypothetical protein